MRELRQQTDAYLFHVPAYGGEQYFVDGVNGLDTNTGGSPDNAFLTIGAAFLAVSDGDAITVRAATYTEIDLDLTADSVEVTFETGVIIIPATGSALTTSLTISGDYCSIKGPHKIEPVALSTGMIISGIEAKISDGKIAGGATGVSVTGLGTTFSNYVAGLQTDISWDIMGVQGRYFECGTVGVGTATYGFKIGAVSAGILRNCTSAGHGTAGFYAGAGSSGWTIIDCSSGSGDGTRVDDGENNMWANFHDTLRREQHGEIYPTPDGEGTAGDAISVTSDASDETNGAETTANYWGEPIFLVPVATFTDRWDFIGINVYASTTNKEIRSCYLRLVASKTATRNAGNAWDEGATVLTVTDATEAALFAVNDKVWIASPGYKPNGEIVKVTDVTGAVITIAREASQFGAPNTGLRWNHTTNDAGNEVMYLCSRDDEKYHHGCFDFSAGSAKDFTRFVWHKARGMQRNDGVIVRAQNGTDGNNGTGYDITAIYQD